MGVKRYNYISAEVYEDSGNIYQTVTLLIDNGFSGYVSPRHNPIDKKPHYHVLVIMPDRHGLSFDRWTDVSIVCKFANNHFKIIDYPHDYARYLIHLRNPEKEQFPDYQVQEFETTYYINPKNIIKFGDAPVYSEYILIEDIKQAKQIQDNKTFSDIIAWINKNECYSYASLVSYATYCKPTWINTVTRFSTPILAYMRSCVFMKGRKYDLGYIPLNSKDIVNFNS